MLKLTGKITGILLLLLMLGIPGSAAADETSAINAGDTAWMLVSTALVMLMTPGLAFFYGGLVRRKNILSIIMQCMAIMCLVSIMWVSFGYSMAFGPDIGHVIGNLDWAMLNQVSCSDAHVIKLMDGAASSYAPNIPHQLFMIFQMMFAVITPALIIGAFAERIRFAPFCVFTVLWSVLVYNPLTHWVWGFGGFLREMGVLDFAGGTVVEINSGMSALAAALFLGRRRNYPHSVAPPHDVPLAVLGAALLWFGWFGFNAGSALGANSVAVNAFVTTHLAGAAAGLAWPVCDWLRHGRPTTLGIISGGIAGMVAITPAAGFVSPAAAIAIGLGAGSLCWVAVSLVKAKFKYDDSLDVFGVHGVGGLWGMIATGLWATTSVNVGGGDGLFAGNIAQLKTQALAAGITLAFSFGMTYALLKLVDVVMKLRVTNDQEMEGLDLSQHNETAYTAHE